MATQTETAVYVYGILPGDVELEAEVTGVGNPPVPVRLVRHRDLAALVSDVDLGKPLGTPADLMAHEELLDASATDAPVLPLRFGALVASEDAVTSELLDPHYEEFQAALEDLEGHAEYVIKGRYIQDQILREVLTENPAAADLAAQVKGADPVASRDLQMQLGEQDTRALGDALAGHVSASVVRPETHELDAVHAAFLVEARAADSLMQAVEQLAADWDGRVDLRVIGPIAAYDFVGTASPAPEG
jgi:hypothetical protein